MPVLIMPPDHPKQTHTRLAHTIEDRLARPMFLLTLLFLVLLALLLHKYDWPILNTLKARGIFRSLGLEEHVAEVLPEPQLFLDAPLGVWLLLPLWLPFPVEAALGFFIRDRSLGFWKPLGRAFLVALLPPVRLAGVSRTRPGHMWLPRHGWCPIDADLRNYLDRLFSVPMILFALLVIPVLGIDYFYSAAVAAHPALRLTLALCNAAIWLAFAVELIFNASVAYSALAYCVTTWVDLTIVLLPMVEVLPVARLFRLGRLTRVSRLREAARIYRLRGLAGKGWHAVIVLKLFQKMLGHSLEKELRQRREELQRKEEEIDRLHREIALLEEEVALEPKEATPEGEEALLSGG
jgi:hypothetical protein